MPFSMAGIRFRCASLLVPLWLLGAGAAGAGERIPDAPVVWHEDDRHPIPVPETRAPNLLWTGPEETVKRAWGRTLDPARWIYGLGGDPVPPASNISGLDEVPNSTWFTNRIGLFPLTPGGVARGPGSGTGPDRGGPWTVVAAKTEGVTPGFTVEDVAGHRYLIKFDPPGFPDMESAAGVISDRILYAAGYNVPDDAVVYFRRDELVLGDGVKIRLPGGVKRNMVAADIDNILARVTREEDGTWRAVSSRYLEGQPVGPFDYKGVRKDDPNDLVRHEHRRELRGLRVFAAWLNHFDTKQQNTLDMYVGEPGAGHLRHYLIDFASTLGTGAFGPSRIFGHEYSLDVAATTGRWLSLGLYESWWRTLERPPYDEIGFFTADGWGPQRYKPQLPNSAFANLTDRDGYWAAKIASAFTDADLEAAVAQGRYRNPEAAAYMVRTLAERRDILARTWFDRVPPLDFFRIEAGTIRFHDLGAERNLYPGTRPRYRYRSALADGEGHVSGWTTWNETDRPELALDATPGLGERTGEGEHLPFLALACAVDRGQGWSSTVTVLFSRFRGEAVRVER